MSYYRTAEHRRLRSEMIHRWRPWEKSTGPRTPEGKARSSRNRWRRGKREQFRTLMRELHSALDEQTGVLDDIADELPALCLVRRDYLP